MSAETADLTKIDSAVSGLSSSPPEEKKGHRRASSSAAGVYNINDLGMSNIQRWARGACRLSSVTHSLKLCTEKEGKELQIAKETQKLNWYVTYL